MWSYPSVENRFLLATVVFGVNSSVKNEIGLATAVFEVNSSVEIEIGLATVENRIELDSNRDRLDTGDRKNHLNF